MAPRRSSIAALLPLAFVALGATASAAPNAGVVVRHQRVTIGAHSSAVTIVTMPRPTGGRTLMPILPGDIVSAGTATTSSVSRGLSRYGTAVAINADLFEYASGQPSGLLLIDGEIYNQPQGGRPALAVDPAGTLSTSRPKATGALILPRGRTLPVAVNVRSGPGAILYDRGWGPSAPAGATRSIVTQITGGAVVAHHDVWKANAKLKVRSSRAGSSPIPSDDGPDLLFQASGPAARTLAQARTGRTIDLRYKLGPLAHDADFAIGGGPILIRKGKIVYTRRGNQEFSNGQLLPPDARTAVAQLADGRILFYAADKGAGSTGLTVAEVARDLKRRGAVTAMSFDSGGSTSVSLNGRLLNQPSDGAERPVGNLLVYFVGTHDARPVGGVSVARRRAGARVPALSYTMVKGAKVSITLTDPKGRLYPLLERKVRAGVHAIRMPASLPLTSGRWTVAVTANDLRDRAAARFIVTAKAAPAVVKPTNQGIGSSGQLAAAQAATPAATDDTPASPADHGSEPSSLPWILLAVALGLITAAVGVFLVRPRRRPRR